QAGKTTLMRENCKITELYTATQQSDVFVNMWLNDQAVIIEPNGLLFEQPDSHAIPSLYTRLWDNLLNWLVDNRYRQPLNGIILTVDLKQLCTYSKDERDNYTQTIQNRLLEINKTTHTNLPIYIIFTKFDLIYGFEATYQSLSKEEREQPLGATFTRDNSKAWQEELKLFWAEWLKQLNYAIPGMMLYNEIGRAQV